MPPTRQQTAAAQSRRQCEYLKKNVATPSSQTLQAKTRSRKDPAAYISLPSNQIVKEHDNQKAVGNPKQPRTLDSVEPNALLENLESRAAAHSCPAAGMGSIYWRPPTLSTPRCTSFTLQRRSAALEAPRIHPGPSRATRVAVELGATEAPRCEAQCR